MATLYDVGGIFGKHVHVHVHILSYESAWNSAVINPRRMCEGYGSRVCVYLVCYHASCYIPG